jgi:2-oxoglutarate ferredoxin oxidoreductase subunit alpha
MGDAIDLLVAFDEEAIQVAAPSMAADGIVVFDASRGPPPPDLLADTVRTYAIPFGRLAVRELRRDLLKNCLGFGVVSRILSIDDNEAADSLRHRFRRLPEAAMEINLEAFRSGLACADEHGLGAAGGPWAVERAEPEERLLISGNHALSLGFLAAGGRFYAGYPITPATEILEWLDRRLPEYGGVAVQAEDEMSAINMAIGAALAGCRAMTGSSGPGISLMLEGVSHVGSAEIPLVIVDCQRAGPSTGMPTKPEQSDVATLAHGGHGDFPRIVLAPADQGDCFTLAVLATNLAQRLQCPVILALDRALAQDQATMAPFDLGGVCIEKGKLLSPEEVAGLAEYRRYAITDDGVSPWAVPGTPGGENLVTGNERDEWGHVSTAPAVRRRMVEKRARKVEAARSDLAAGWRFGDTGAAVGLIGVGMVGGVMERAAERLVAAGVDVQCLRPRTLWPVSEETVAFVRERRRVYVIEHSEGAQLARLIASAGAPLDKMRNVLKYDGTPFRAKDLVEEIAEREADAP